MNPSDFTILIFIMVGFVGFEALVLTFVIMNRLRSIEYQIIEAQTLIREKKSAQETFRCYYRDSSIATHLKSRIEHGSS